jgi:hypothetical protein
MRFSGSLMPFLPTDKKSAPLCVTPIWKVSDI